jgi:hypothetical protein
MTGGVGGVEKAPERYGAVAFNSNEKGNTSTGCFGCGTAADCDQQQPWCQRCSMMPVPRMKEVTPANGFTSFGELM